MKFLRSAIPWLLQVLVLAVVYAAAGRAALLFAIPPGVATGAFPPAGIAIAALLIWGYRLWPGVLLGSVVLVLSAASDDRASPTLAVCIGLGSTVQALLGVWLIRRFVGYPLVLNNGSSIGKFVLLSGPVVCLTAATWSIASLCLFGAMTRDFTTNWITWWIGDTIGVLVFLPLLLIAFGQPRELWRKRWLSVGLPLVALFVANVGVLHFSEREQQTNSELAFARRAGNLESLLTQRIESYLEVVHGVALHLQHAEPVSRNEFRGFVGRDFERHPGICALGWIPRIPAAKREEFILAARRDATEEDDPLRHDALKSFTIKEWCEDETWKPYDENDALEYFPVYHLEPYRENERALGIDLASNPERRAALEHARDRGRPVATQPLTLAQETGDRRGFLLVIPIYAKGSPTETVQQRRDNLSGYASGVFRVWDIVHSTLSAVERDGIRLRILDESSDLASPQLLYEEAPHGADTQISRDQSDFQHFFTHDVSGRTWRMQFTPSRDALAEMRGSGSWPLSLALSMLTIAVCSSLLLVAATSETTLRESEQRFRSMFQLAAVGIAQVAPDGRFLRVNQRLCDILGYSPRELMASNFQQITHPDDLDLDLTELQRTLRGEIDTYTIEKRYQRKDRSIVWTNLAVALVRDDSGAPKYFVSIIEDIGKRRHAEEELEKEKEFLRSLIDVQESERQMVAHDIHDGVTQDIVGAQMQLQGILTDLAQDPYGPKLQSAETSLAKAVAECRRLIRDTRPMILDEAGVIDAITHHVAEENARGELTLEFRHDVRFQRLAPKLEGTIFRIVQEAISNIRKHSRAERASVELTQHKQMLKIVIRDEGVGFVPAQVSPQSFGLRGMRERARLFGGDVTIDSKSDCGTSVEAWLPIVIAPEE